jgi:predicted nicotinamide N-methyase
MSLFRFDFLGTPDGDGHATHPCDEITQVNTISETTASGANDFQFCLNPCWLERANQNLDYDLLPLESKNQIEPLKKCRHLGNEGDASMLDIESQQTDIVPGIYEGGLKVWECSVDLCKYLAKHPNLMTPRYCLELGCGQALPACLILRESLKQKCVPVVMFTDYNDFVVNGVTMSNIVLNVRALDGTFPLDLVAKHSVLGYGDWIDMSRQLASNTHGIPSLPSDGRFDLILAAETTYTADSARDTAILLTRHLVPQTGIGLVATKRYYFGVGGGSDALREAAGKEQITIQGVDYVVHIEPVQEFEDGTSNIRDLLAVTLQPLS